jgi:hypothetical protein
VFSSMKFIDIKVCSEAKPNSLYAVLLCVYLIIHPVSYDIHISDRHGRHTGKANLTASQM